MDITVTLGIVVIVLLIILFAVSKSAIKEHREKLAYKAEAERKSNTIDYLYKHFEEIEKARAEGNKIEQELENAETDEEVLSIVSSVVSNNNDRLRKQTKKK